MSAEPKLGLGLVDSLTLRAVNQINLFINFPVSGILSQ